ncbi:SCO3374 family protein [Streptomyces sp. NPDC006529]|uniref:SCO3374 family protein n=1 Tax=Streptomyces sp. NPDC006529 TaxID=3157177 RepID=UPI0033B47163
MTLTVPLPRVAPEAAHALWYERVLGWTVTGGPPPQLVTGTRFDVLDMPADAGTELLHGPLATGPVALTGRRMRFLVAAGSADELDGLLDWLEWGGVALDLTALGAGGRMTAPAPPGAAGESPRGAAVWLRPPEQGCDVLLPALPIAGQGARPDLARLVGAAATACHRARLRRSHGSGAPLRGAPDQPLFS